MVNSRGEKRTTEGRAYKALQCLAHFAVWAYFRNVKVICRAPISQEGPLLVAANHMNMVLDPATLIATFPHGRACHFWALARFFRIPVAGKLLYAAGILPVDTKTHSNAKLFEHTLSCLENGGVIALFPEGTSYTAPRHLPFKDGLSWAAYEYLSHQREQKKTTGHDASEIGVSIVPVGITYTTKNKWRSDVIVEYGEPIRLHAKDLDHFLADPKPAVKKLTADIAKGVERGTINSPDWDTLNAASEARSLLFGDARGVRLEDYVKVSQSFIEIFDPAQLDPKNENALLREERVQLKLRLLAFSKTLRLLRLTALDISMYENREITLQLALLRLIGTWTSLAIQLPFFLPGIVVNWPIYILGRLTERFEKYTESVAQDKVVFSVVLAIPLYGTLFYQCWKYFEFTFIGFVVATALIPILAWYHMALVDRRYDMAKQVVASWRICVAVLSEISGFDANPRRELEDAVQLRRWCHTHTRLLLLELAKANEPHAQYLVDYAGPLLDDS